MGKAIIGHENVLDGAIIYSGDEETDFPADNCVDGRTNTQVSYTKDTEKHVIFDLLESKSINFIGVAKHNLQSVKAYIKVYSSTIGPYGPWDEELTVSGFDVHPNWDDSDDSTIMRRLTEFDTQYLRIEYRWLAGAAAEATIFLSVLALGKYIEPPIGMPVGFQQPRWGDQDEIRVNKSRGNDFVGMSVIDKPRASTIILKNIEVSWFDVYWSAFVADMKKRPFFVAWNPDDRIGEAAYCWPVKKIAAPKYTKKTRCSVSLKVEGITQ